MGVSDMIFGTSAQKYDPNSDAAKQAATVDSHGALSNASRVQGTNAPTAQTAQLNTGNYDQVRGQQMGLAGQLAQQANGGGPSAAAMTGQQGRDAALTSANAVLSGQRGGRAGAGVLGASQAASAGQQQANQTQAQGQANEMATARQAQAGVLGGLAGQDLNVSGQNAGLAQQANLANQQANLSQQGLGLQAGSQELQAGTAEQAARLQEQQLYANTLDKGSTGLLGSAVSSFAGGAGQALGMMSDRRAKTEIRRAGGLGAQLTRRD